MYNKFKQVDGQEILINMDFVQAILPAPQGVGSMTLIMTGYQIVVLGTMPEAVTLDASNMVKKAVSAATAESMAKASIESDVAAPIP